MIGFVIGVVIGGLVGVLGASRGWSVLRVIVVSCSISVLLTFAVLWLAKVSA